MKIQVDIRKLHTLIQEIPLLMLTNQNKALFYHFNQSE